jgi:ribosomal protein S18 acetylase RimI-like enzyme
MAAPIDIRILRAGDEAILAKVGPEVFDDPVDTEATRRFLADPGHHLAVAIDAGTVVGFASAVHYFHPDKSAPEMWINEVGVATTHRERGLGKQILDELLREARALGCSEAWVLTDRSNRPALRLYASMGGTETPHEQVLLTFRFDAKQPPD